MPMRQLGGARNIPFLSNAGINGIGALTHLMIWPGVPGMATKRPLPKKLSVTAEIELKRLMTLCRKLWLSASKLRKVKRIVRIMYDQVE